MSACSPVRSASRVRYSQRCASAPHRSHVISTLYTCSTGWRKYCCCSAGSVREGATDRVENCCSFLRDLVPRVPTSCLKDNKVILYETSVHTTTAPGCVRGFHTISQLALIAVRARGARIFDSSLSFEFTKCAGTEIALSAWMYRVNAAAKYAYPLSRNWLDR